MRAGTRGRGVSGAAGVGGGFLYEPERDGFSCVAFPGGDVVALRSESGQPLGRYFPEIIEALRALPAERFGLDGEIVIQVDFDALLQRLHPAESRIKKLARVMPAAHDALAAVGLSRKAG